MSRILTTGFGIGPPTLTASPGKYGYYPTNATISSGFVVTSQVFPRIGVQAIGNLGVFPTANLQQLAQYQFIVMGGNYDAWPSNNASGGGYGTRAQVVDGLHSFTGGKNAVRPIIVQYENPSEFNTSSPWFPDWYNKVNANNWFLYESGSSGTKTPSAWNSSWDVVNPAHVVGQDSSTGFYPYQLVAYLYYRRYWLGLGSGGSSMAASNLDGSYLDNQAPWNYSGGPSDWLRVGSTQSQTDPTTVVAVTTGKADYPAEIRAQNSNLLVSANVGFGYALSSGSVGGLGISSANVKTVGTYDYPQAQFMFGEPSATGGQSNPLDFAGFSGFMSWYQTCDSALRAGGATVLTGGYLKTNYQGQRYALCAVLMRNGIMMMGYLNGNPTTEDITDPATTSTYPVLDEFWGGSLNLAGYLGVAIDSPQTSSWLQGVWRRRFVGGWALVNPKGNGSQTVSLGTTMHKLTGSQVPSINNGASVTSVTLADGDGLILIP